VPKRVRSAWSSHSLEFGAGHHNWRSLDQRVILLANLGHIPSPSGPRARFHSSYQLACRYSENMAPLNNGAHVTHTSTA
jgi:hypothetical protein